MKSISIVDNFLDQLDFKKIQQMFFSRKFPWYYCQGVNYTFDQNHQFVHPFSHNGKSLSEFDYELSPIYKKLNYFILVRCKSNLLVKTKTKIEHGFHIDMADLEDYHNPKTAIFYINTNNGYTKFENGDIVESVENRMVIFDSRINHTGSTCTDKNARVVVNFNFF